MSSAGAVANAFLKELPAGRSIDSVKLQKLLYFAQGWHLHFFHEPLIEDDFQAWKLGPVVPSIYDQHARMKSIPDTFVFRATDELDGKGKAIVDYVIARYGGVNTFALVDETHRVDTPWYRATYPDGRVDALYYQPIPTEEIEAYFGNLNPAAA